MTAIWARTGKIASALVLQPGLRPPDPSGGTTRAGQPGNLLEVRDRCACAGRLGEEIEDHVVVVAGRERLIGIGSSSGIARYGQARPEQPVLAPGPAFRCRRRLCPRPAFRPHLAIASLRCYVSASIFGRTTGPLRLALPGARFRLSPNSTNRELATKPCARSHVHIVSERTLL